MTKSQLQNEIQKILQNIPENLLQDILALLQGIQNQPEDKIELSHALRKILDEDKALLEKLAQ
jgi:hypothetical protein